MRLTPELKNVLNIAKKVKSKTPVKETSKYDGWEYYKFDFKLDNKSFEGIVNIGIDRKGKKHFYEVNNIKKTSGISDISPNRPTGFSKDNIPQQDKSVKYSMQESTNNTQELDNSSFSLKQKQLDIILKHNPVQDGYHTWIRTIEDIKTFEETLQDSDYKKYYESTGTRTNFSGIRQKTSANEVSKAIEPVINDIKTISEELKHYKEITIEQINDANKKQFKLTNYVFL